MRESKSRSKLLSKQCLIGLVGVATIAMFIWFAFFLKGKNLFSSENTFYAVYTTTHGINVSDPVILNGMKIGRVGNIDFISENDRRIKLTIQILKKHKVPENSVAALESLGLMSGSGVVIHLGNSSTFKKHGSTFESIEVPGLMEQLDPMVANLSSMLAHADSILNNLHQVFGSNTVTLLGESFVSINSSLKNIDNISLDARNLLISKKSEISNIISNLNKLSLALAQNSGKIDNVITNFSNLSDTIANANIGKTLNSLTSSMQKLENVINGIDKGEGTAGKLLKDKGLYESLDSASMQLNLLLEDIRLNPGRYIHISVFGKKDKTTTEKNK